MLRQSGLAIAILIAGSATPLETDSQTIKYTHMSEALRSAVTKVVVLPGTTPGKQNVTGSYERQTPGLLGGATDGSRIGDGVSKDIGGIRVNFPIPILTIPGAIFGGLTGKAKQEIQDFRDALTNDLLQSANRPLSNDKLASDVFWSLRTVPGLEPKLFALTTPIPNDTDAILYVSLANVTINVDGKEAIITTTADATLRRLSDGLDVYSRQIHYQDRDTLSNWTRNDNALWRDYANFARHYVGREISAEVFERVQLRHDLQPKESETVSALKKNDWQGASRSTTPTLAWELNLLGGDSYGAWASALKDEDISFDVEIYDMHRLVYAAKRIRESRHTVAVELDPCQTYRWSVRPTYHVGSETKFGEWMRAAADSGTENGGVGRKVSAAPAYIQDFASLEISCSRK